MARLQGISGGMSGRTGSFTYRQSRGQTIVSQYQPIVKNPNTQGQANQRAKFKLLSQLASIMKDGFGTMGINERPARQRPTLRNAFMHINMPAVTVTDGTATIQMEYVKLTSSNTPLGSIEQESAEDANVIIRNVNSAVQSVRFVEIVYKDYPTTDTSTGTIVVMKRPEIRRIVDRPVSEGNTAEFISQDGATVLCFGLIPSESLTGVNFNNIYTPNDEGFIAAVALNQMVSNGLIAETMTLGINLSV